MTRFVCNATLAASSLVFAVGPQDSDAIEDPALTAAETYRELFRTTEQLEEDLGESYDAILFPELDDQVEPTDAQRQRFRSAVERQLETLGKLANKPAVDWGMKAEFEEKGPGALIPQVGSIRRLAQSAGWYAKEVWDEDPEAAMNALTDAMAAARHADQKPSTLISHLTRLACDGILLGTLAELSPLMSPQQRSEVLSRIEALPRTGTLGDALETERDYFAGWLEKKLLRELERWEKEKFGPDGFRFPADLRLAGIARLPNRPIRISLHNSRLGKTFWLEKGQEVDGIRLKRVDRERARAWIAYDGLSARIDLEKEMIERSRVPWEVLYATFVAPDWKERGYTEAEMRETLKEYGVTPEIALTQFQQIRDYYTEAIRRIDDPIEEFRDWNESTAESFEEESLAAILIPNLSGALENNRAFEKKHEALELGFKLQSSDLIEEGTVEFGNSKFSITRNAEGFSIIPTEFADHEKRNGYSLHFGTPPPDPAEN